MRRTFTVVAAVTEHEKEAARALARLEETTVSTLIVNLVRERAREVGLWPPRPVAGEGVRDGQRA